MRFLLSLLFLTALLWPQAPTFAAVCLYDIPVESPSGQVGPSAPEQGCTPLRSSTINPDAQTAECAQICSDNLQSRWSGCQVDQGSCPSGARVQANPTTTTQLLITHIDNPLGRENNTTLTELLPGLIGRLIRSALGFVGTITMLVFLYGGFMWLTSAGNEEKVTRGTHAMAYAAIGICIIFSSYAILSIVFRAVGSG